MNRLVEQEDISPSPRTFYELSERTPFPENPAHRIFHDIARRVGSGKRQDLPQVHPGQKKEKQEPRTRTVDQAVADRPGELSLLFVRHFLRLKVKVSKQVHTQQHCKN